MNKSFRILATPYQIWLMLLVFVPLLAMIIISFTNLTSEVPLNEVSFTLANFLILGETSTLVAFKNSLVYASLSTIICFVLGYFIAYKIKTSRFNNKFIVLTIVILPMWSNLILRAEALMNVMSENNIIKSLIGFSILGNTAGTGFAVLFGLVFTYMPFMILPIYTTLEKIDPALEEAALDLGLTPFKKFWKVVFPLSFRGVVSGSIMVFLPTLAGFAIPKIISRGQIIFIGNIIDTKFMYTSYDQGALLAVLILVFILGSILLLTRFDKEGETLL
ncbi:MAG TPA: ABC transporter permease [Bacillota bacterium]|nr:ABC transporter permease [Bacillota bacterium]HPJ86204.1 ABC transporter permease [Bacillota bacterium]HPQ62262.1 ABC transporter permease [Bacillota bacterium]HRX92093.1 ABC transporter permease [Candidatus Izemoplasmatales bacterium]